MSVQALGWVLDHSPTKGSDRLVLISIANHAGPTPATTNGGDTWEAWPGIATIQREAGLDRPRTVTDAITRLVEKGHLIRKVNGSPDDRIRRDHRPNLFGIVLGNGVSCGDTRCRWCGVSPDARRGVATRPDGVSDSDATGCRDATPEPLVQPSGEPDKQPNNLFDADQAGAVVVPIGVEFDRFYSAYPRHVAPAAARKAYTAARKRADAATILAGAVRYEAEMRGRPVTWVAHPSTWLNGDRWLDAPGANTAPPTPGARQQVTRQNHTPGRIHL